MMSFTRTISLTIGTAAATAALSTAVLAIAADGKPENGAHGGRPSPVSTIPAKVAGVLAAFRRDATPSDEMPGDPVAALEAVDDWQPGENPLLARRLTLASGNYGYVWPMLDGVCYGSPGAAGCVSIDVLRARGVLITTASSTDSPMVKVFGIAVDGVKAVTMTLADGSEVVAPFNGGAFYVEVTSDPTTARWKKPDGTPVEQSPVLVRPS